MGDLVRRLEANNKENTWKGVFEDSSMDQRSLRRGPKVECSGSLMLYCYYARSRRISWVDVHQNG
jgi:hypothetical protein